MRRDRVRRTLVALLSVIALSVFGQVPIATAATFPGYSTSYYIVSYNTTTAYNEGCSLGTAVKNFTKPQTTLVVLDFFSQYYSGGWGTKGDDGVFHAISAAESVAHEWAHGFWICTGSDTTARLILAMGTRNIWFPNTLTNAQVATRGTEWADVVDLVNTNLGSYASQVTVQGAIDAEVNWASPSPTLAWANAYDAATTHIYYDYGDAAGCPPYGSCAPYTQSQLYSIAYGISGAFALPEIYTTNGSQAAEWQQISLWGYSHGSFGRISFTGSFTQAGACAQNGCSASVANSASAGWNQLWNAVSGDSRTAISNIPYSTDIRWNNKP